jgi:hypothetical protein
MLKIKDIRLSNTKKKNLNGLSQWVSIKVKASINNFNYSI